MGSDPVLRNLLFLYAGSMLLNVGISAALFVRDRNPVYRSLLLAWAAMSLSFVVQGAMSEGALVIVGGFTTAFWVNLAFARLLASVTDQVLRWRRYVLLMVGALGVSVAIWAAGAGFTFIALPTVLAVAAPCLVTAAKAIVRRQRLTTSTLLLLVVCVAFSLHNIDFAFLRHRPEMATLGFTVAVLVTFGLSIAGPAVALERVTEKQVRLSTELDVARRIQSLIIPREQALPGLEMACHVRSAESVGGDYLDVYREGDRCWFMIGDVTGHGLGAGLVMLMAQSTMSSLLHARPDITPRELNFLANRVLAGNLQRLEERRHLTAISVLRQPGNRFVVSGSHDALFVYRAATSSVEERAVNHFPVGLGFLGGLDREDFREEPLELAPGDLLFLVTDGLTEAAQLGDPRRGLFGSEPVRSILARHAGAPLNVLKEHVLSELDRFTGGTYHDDVAFLVLRVRDEERHA